MAPSVGISRSQRVRDFPIADSLSSKQTTTTQVHELTTTPSPPRPSQGPLTLILNPSFITTDFDTLRFSAAASSQLPSSSRLSTPPSDSDSDSDSAISTSPAYSPLLISSPYNIPGHYLPLTSLSTPSRLFALALTTLQPVHTHYATESYTTSLNFPVVLSTLRSLAAAEGVAWRETSFYVVVFRSRLKEDIDQEWLYRLDFESHAEACESGGLLKYWFGKGDGERRNLATCFWHSRADAQKGGQGPWHAKARRAGRELYESIVFSTHRFTVLDGAGGYRFEDWVDED